jgi:hypothetical protein
VGRVIPIGVIALVVLIAVLSVIIARFMTRSYRDTIRQRDKEIARLSDENAELRKDEGEKVAELRRRCTHLEGVFHSVEGILRGGTVPGFDSRPIHIYAADQLRDARPNRREV